MQHEADKFSFSVFKAEINILQGAQTDRRGNVFWFYGSP